MWLMSPVHVPTGGTPYSSEYNEGVLEVAVRQETELLVDIHTPLQMPLAAGVNCYDST